MKIKTNLIYKKKGKKKEKVIFKIYFLKLSNNDCTISSFFCFKLKTNIKILKYY